jgi:ApaG protein
VIVHHIKVNDIRTGCNDGFYLVAQAREISGQNAGGDAKCRRCLGAIHSAILPVSPLAGVPRVYYLPEKIPPMSNKAYDISVKTRTVYIADQSDPASDRYVFAYTITITNTGSAAAQLVSRHWIITDAADKVQEVRGKGVVGEQPHLRPGESFEYTSGSAIATPVGTMRGSYQMVADDGTQFDVTIPEFTLSMPRVLH